MKRIILLLALFASTCTLKASSLTTKQALHIAATTHQRQHRYEHTRYHTPNPGRSRRGPKGKEKTRALNCTKDKRSSALQVSQLEDAHPCIDTIISKPELTINTPAR